MHDWAVDFARLTKLQAPSRPGSFLIRSYGAVFARPTKLQVPSLHGSFLSHSCEVVYARLTKLRAPFLHGSSLTRQKSLNSNSSSSCASQLQCFYSYPGDRRKMQDFEETEIGECCPFLCLYFSSSCFYQFGDVLFSGFCLFNEVIFSGSSLSREAMFLEIV